MANNKLIISFLFHLRVLGLGLLGCFIIGVLVLLIWYLDTHYKHYLAGILLLVFIYCIGRVVRLVN